MTPECLCLGQMKIGPPNLCFAGSSRTSRDRWRPSFGPRGFDLASSTPRYCNPRDGRPPTGWSGWIPSLQDSPPTRSPGERPLVAVLPIGSGCPSSAMNGPTVRAPPRRQWAGYDMPIEQRWLTLITGASQLSATERPLATSSTSASNSDPSVLRCRRCSSSSARHSTTGKIRRLLGCRTRRQAREQSGEPTFAGCLPLRS